MTRRAAAAHPPEAVATWNSVALKGLGCRSAPEIAPAAAARTTAAVETTRTARLDLQ
jgi:hypothetical protein